MRRWSIAKGSKLSLTGGDITPIAVNPTACLLFESAKSSSAAAQAQSRIKILEKVNKQSSTQVVRGNLCNA